MVSVSLVLFRIVIAPSIIKSSAVDFRKLCHEHFGGVTLWVQPHQVSQVKSYVLSMLACSSLVRGIDFLYLSPNLMLELLHFLILSWTSKLTLCSMQKGKRSSGERVLTP